MNQPVPTIPLPAAADKLLDLIDRRIGDKPPRDRAFYKRIGRDINEVMRLVDEDYELRRCQDRRAKKPTCDQIAKSRGHDASFFRKCRDLVKKESQEREMDARRKGPPPFHSLPYEPDATLQAHAAYEKHLKKPKNQATEIKHNDVEPDAWKPSVDPDTGMTVFRAPGLTIYLAEMLVLLRTLPSGSIQLIVLDPPYGGRKTRYPWDIGLDWDSLIPELLRVLAPAGVMVIHCKHPLTGELVHRLKKHWHSNWVWLKDTATDFKKSGTKPLGYTEDVLVFNQLEMTEFIAEIADDSVAEVDGDIMVFRQSHKQMTFNPQTIPLGVNSRWQRYSARNKPLFGKMQRTLPTVRWVDAAHPTNVLPIGYDERDRGVKFPGRKPVALYEYLIKTYSNPGDLVFDGCIGSGSIAIACLITGRQLIACEKEASHFEMTCRRVKEWLRVAAGPAASEERVPLSDEEARRIIAEFTSEPDWHPSAVSIREPPEHLSDEEANRIIAEFMADAD